MTDPKRASLTRINPAGLGPASGFTHGLLAPVGSQTLLVAGQTAVDEHGRISDRAFGSQFETALRRVLAVVAEAGGRPEHIARMTVYVTDMEAYRAARPALRGVWKHLLGNHYPAMSLVEVSRLVDTGAVVEIEATALLPPVLA